MSNIRRRSRACRRRGFARRGRGAGVACAAPRVACAAAAASTAAVGPGVVTGPARRDSTHRDSTPRCGACRLPGRRRCAGPVPERRPGHDGRRGDRFRVLYAYPERTTGRSAYPTRNRKRPIRARPDEPETRRGTDGTVNTIREATRILRYLPAYLKRHRAARVILAHTWRLHRSPGRAARRTGGGRRAPRRCAGRVGV